MILHVNVKPNSNKRELIRLIDGTFIAYLKEPAENNKY